MKRCRGFLQREIKDALDIWRQMLDSDIYLIPIRLEDCEVPESLRDFQWVDLFEEDGLTRLVKAIRVGTERRAEVPADKELSSATEMAIPEEGPDKLQTIVEQIVNNFANKVLEKGLTNEAILVSFTPLVVFNVALRIAKWWSLYWAQEVSLAPQPPIPEGKDLEYFFLMDTIYGFHLQHFRETGNISKIVLPHGNSDVDPKVAWRKYMDYFFPMFLKDQADPLKAYLTNTFFEKGFTPLASEIAPDSLSALIECRANVMAVGMNVYTFFNMGPIESL